MVNLIYLLTSGLNNLILSDCCQGLVLSDLYFERPRARMAQTLNGLNFGRPKC
jgi:hypothetical protein